MQEVEETVVAHGNLFADLQTGVWRAFSHTLEMQVGLPRTNMHTHSLALSLSPFLSLSLSLSLSFSLSIVTYAVLNCQR
jgi:hypothetical protein